jgi:hypothetical protein
MQAGAALRALLHLQSFGQQTTAQGQCTQQKSSSIEFHISKATITPATESARDFIASW